MESTTGGRVPETAPSGASAVPGAKPSAAAPKSKPKPAAKKPRARATTAKRKASPEPRLSQVTATRTLTLDEVQQPQRALELAEIGMELADIVTGAADRGEKVSYGESNEVSAEYRGLTLDEVSELLARRESRGFQRGHAQGYSDARRSALVRLQRERQEAVAGSLRMVANQLQSVLHDLADTGADRKAEGARRLAVLVAEFERAADRFASGEAGEA